MGKIVGLVFPVDEQEPATDRNVGSTDEELICEVCGKVYKTAEGLQKHIAEKHGY